MTQRKVFTSTLYLEDKSNQCSEEGEELKSFIPYLKSECIWDVWVFTCFCTVLLYDIWTLLQLHLKDVLNLKHLRMYQIHLQELDPLLEDATAALNSFVGEKWWCRDILNNNNNTFRKVSESSWNWCTVLTEHFRVVVMLGITTATSGHTL